MELDALLEAVRSGSRVEALTAIRDFLAAALTEAPATAVAPITRQLTEVLRQLDESGAGEEDAVDEFTAKRQARIAAASGQ